MPVEFFQLPFFLGDLYEKKPEDIPNHYTIGQTLDIIDKSILRICIYEIKFNELNPSIAMDEAIEIAKVFGSDKSAAFINGVIDSLVQNDKI